MAYKKSKKTTVKSTHSSKKQPQINVLFMTIALFILALGFTLILLKADNIKKAATTPRFAGYVDEGVFSEPATKEELNTSRRFYFGYYDVKLPPIGPLCEGCRDGMLNGVVDRSLFEDGEWIEGGNFVDHKNGQYSDPGEWNFIEYRLAGELPVIPTGKDLGKFPGGSFLKDASEMKVGTTRTFNKGKVRHTYTKKEPLLVHGQRIWLFDVKPTFQTGYLGRKDALFVRGGKTFYIVFDWRDKKFSDTLESILQTINFDVPAPTKMPDDMSNSPSNTSK